jgi:pyruvate/2-oxoglutarate dehydrogenase complex dihydrolipoamide dehydrogenase (E3) component
MTETRHYDAVVIGTGQGGKPLAGALAAAGHRTAIIEREHVGGSCVNVGCTPTKTMVASARAVYMARRASDYGVETGPVEINMTVVRRRKRDIVEQFRGGSEKSLNNAEGIDLLLGDARFVGPKELEVDLNGDGDLRLTADRVFINTGTRPAMPPVEGLVDVPALDSTTIMELDEVPEHLVVLGGGYVGLEFGQMFRRFGSDVTIVQRRNQLLPREGADVAEAVADILREDGIEVLLGSDALRAEKKGTGGIKLRVNTPDGERDLEGSHLLVATGRVPNTDTLGLDSAGVEADARGFVNANDRLETSAEGVWVLGDVKGGPAFTHISYDDFQIVRENLLEGGDASIEGRIVPYTVYTDPQLGRVGLTEKEAQQSGYEVKVAKMPMKYVARAMEVEETRGVMKVVVDAGSSRILGASILGIEGGELMSMVHIAMLGDLPFTLLRDAPFAHPTLAESFNNLFAGIE